MDKCVSCCYDLLMLIGYGVQFASVIFELFENMVAPFPFDKVLFCCFGIVRIFIIFFVLGFRFIDLEWTGEDIVGVSSCCS